MSLSARRMGAYVVTVPAVGLGVWVGVVMARANAMQFALTPLALAVVFCAWFGGLGPGLFGLMQSVLAISFNFIDAAALLRVENAAQAAGFSTFVIGWSVFCFLTGRQLRQWRADRQLRIVAEGASS